MELKEVGGGGSGNGGDGLKKMICSEKCIFIITFTITFSYLFL